MLFETDEDTCEEECEYSGEEVPCVLMSEKEKKSVILSEVGRIKDVLAAVTQIHFIFVPSVWILKCKVNYLSTVILWLKIMLVIKFNDEQLTKLFWDYVVNVNVTDLE